MCSTETEAAAAGGACAAAPVEAGAVLIREKRDEIKRLS